MKCRIRRRGQGANRRMALLLAAAGVPLAIDLRQLGAAPAHIYDTGVAGNYNTPGIWNPNGVPIADAVSGTNFGDIAIIHGGTNVVTISSDVGAAQLYVGSTLDYGSTSGSGVVNQTGGTLTLRGGGGAAGDQNWLIIGDRNGETGTYNLSGGAINVTGADALGVGQHGIGSLNISGTAIVNAPNVYIGRWTDGSGAVSLSGGALNSTNTFVGYQGIGTFNQSGGTHTASNLYLGQNVATASGVYSMSNGASLRVTNELQIGGAGSGTFTQTGGNASVGVSTTLGASGGIGTFNLSGGTFTTTVLDVNNASVFNQTGGLVVVSGTTAARGLTIGNINSVGSYNLSGGSLTTLGLFTYIGKTGLGSFTQTGGTHRTGAPILGDAIGSSGTYTLTAGSFIASSTEYVGYRGNGNFDQSGGTHTAFGLVVGSFTNGTNTSNGIYSISNGATLSVSANFNNLFVIGGSGNGTLNQTGGSIVAHGGMILASLAGGTGTVNLSGGSLTTPSLTINNTSAFNLAGGSLNSGTITLNNGQFNYNSGALTGANYVQSGGAFTVTATNGLSLAAGTNATGSYTLSNGILNVAKDENVGFTGNGTFVQSGGTHILSGSNSNGLILGWNPGASGTYTLSGGLISATNAVEYVGLFGKGTFNHSGGTNNVGRLYIGYNRFSTNSAAAFGIYSVSAGATLNINPFLELGVGQGSAGVFNQTGGNVTVQIGTFIDLFNDASSGTMNISGGFFRSFGLTVQGTNSIFNETGGTVSISTLYLNSGTFNQSSGNLSILTVNQTGGNYTSPALNIGSAGPAFLGVSNYNLSGGTLNTGTMSFTNSGGFGASFNQSAGAAVATGGMLMGSVAGTGGTVNLSGGLLTTPTVAINNASTINQTGGTFTITGTNAALLIGSVATSTAAFTLSSNGASLSVAGSETVGNTGVGVFNQSAGSHTVGGALTILNNGTSAFNFTGGTLSVGSLDTSGTPSRFNWPAGALKITNSDLTIDSALFTSPLGSALTLGNGQSLNVTLFEYVGRSGTGSISQSGGTHIVGSGVFSGLTLGLNASGSGTYTLSGGTLSVPGGFGETIGNIGSGVFNQSGGVNTTPGLVVGALNGSGSGIYNLSGGTVNATTQEVIGQLTTGTFNHSGGSNVIKDLSISAATNAVGTYNLSGGASSILRVTGSEYVGNAGPGVFNHSGGINTPAALYVGYFNGTNAATAATYNMSNGATLAVTVNEFVGFSGAGTFNQLGGTHTSQNWVYLGYNSTGVGTYNMSGGTLNAIGEDVGESGTGTFNQFGGSNTVGFGGLNIAAGTGSTGSYHLSGGTLVAPVNNQGTFGQTGGSYNGNFTNNAGFSYGGGTFLGLYVHGANGSFSASTPFDAKAGVRVFGTLSIPLNTSVSGDGIGVDIEGGTIAMSGGILGGTARLLNNGTLTGFGTLTGSGGMTNNAVIAVSGGNLVFSRTGVNINSGNIAIDSGRQFQLNAPLNNAGAIQLGGGLISGASGLNNSSGSITGPGTILAPVTNTGTIQSTGGSLNITQPMINGGLVVLSGIGATLSGGAITNNSSIQGAGTVANVLTNNGTIDPLGGTLNFTNPMANNVGGILRAGVGNEILASGGLAINAGAITLSGGTFDNNNHDLTNKGQISGFGTFATAALTNDSGKTIALTGGTLTAQNVVNNGSFNQSGGQATMLALSGTGSTTVGGASTALVSVASFAQGGVSIQNGGTLFARPSALPHTVTDTVGALTIAASGLLDINNHVLRLDNTRTAFSASKGYWNAGYNNDPSAGFGLWNGNHGITSSVAKASAQVDGKITIGYLDGAAQIDFGGTYASLIGGPVMSNTETLFRPTLMGDLNLDGFCNGDDIGIIISLGYYGSGTAPHGWLDGDLNGDGSVDGNDIGLIISTGTYNAAPYGGAKKAAKSAATLSGSSVVANTIEGQFGDGKFDFIYDWGTGDVKITYDGDPAITQAKPLQRLKLASLGGRFITANLNTSGFGTATKTNTLLDCAQAQGSIADGYDLGYVLPARMDPQTLLADLTLNWQVSNGGLGVRNGDMAIIDVPEPSALALIGMSAMGLLARRRKRN